MGLKFEHIAVASNSEGESDKFFVKLLGLDKLRTFTVSNDKMNKFFNIDEEHKFIRYEKQDLSVEVIITNKQECAKDNFTHSCISVENCISLIERADTMGYDVKKVPREKNKGYYLFIKDSFGNVFEIKEL
ncbi:MAG: VOC family protein [Candidatus Lokiarchaeota archaeon]